jgi:hypothetical protein
LEARKKHIGCPTVNDDDETYPFGLFLPRHMVLFLLQLAAI